MDGILFAAGLVLSVTVAGMRSRHSPAAPGALFMLALAAGSIWYVFA